MDVLSSKSGRNEPTAEPAIAAATRATDRNAVKPSLRSRVAQPELKVTHVITGLGQGGAEAMLLKLISATRGTRLRHAVVSLTDMGVFGHELAAGGIAVTPLGMRPGVPSATALVRLVSLLRSHRPDVVHSWMYHANLLAGLAAAAARVPVIWGIHHSDVDPRNTTWLTRLTRAACARLSTVVPARIVCCAESALHSHVGLGYSESRMLVIANGFDATRFRADRGERVEIRNELSIPDGAPVIGLVARFHPDKDHATFLNAARLVTEARPEAVFLLVGDGIEWRNAAVSGAIDQLGLRRSVRLVGRRQDVPALLSAMDVLTSSSRSEGFPQVIGEAMLCGVPCAVTDCGDSREIVGSTGRIVPVRDARALADAILDLLALAPGERAALGAAARERIATRYDIGVVAARYASLYGEVVASRGARRC